MLANLSPKSADSEVRVNCHHHTILLSPKLNKCRHYRVLHHIPVHAPNQNHAAFIQCLELNQALVDQGLVTTGIHQSKISTPLILTGIWYKPAWSGAVCEVSGTRISAPTSITGHQSMKCPWSPHRQQAGPGLPTALVAGSESSYWRGESNEYCCGPHAGLPHPPLDGALGPATDSGGGPRGGMGTRKWDRMSGRRDSRGREKQMAGIRRLLGTPPSGPPPIGWPGLATSGCGTGPTLQSSSGDDRLTAPAPLGRGSARRHLPRPAAIFCKRAGAVEQARRAGHYRPGPVTETPGDVGSVAQADLLDDSSHQVSEDQEILDGQMLGRHLHLPEAEVTHMPRPTSRRDQGKIWSSCGPILFRGRWVGPAGFLYDGLPVHTSWSIQLRNSSRSSCWACTRVWKRHS